MIQMVAKVSEMEIKELIHLVFDKGLTFKEACEKVGRHQSVLSKIVRNMGYEIPRETGKNTRKKTDDESIVNMYKDGHSELEVSKHFKVSRALVRSRLIEYGVRPRTQSEASLVSASRATPEQRKARALAANKAIRGQSQPIESRIKRAKTLEDNAYEHIIGHGEIELKSALENLGIDFTWQKAFDKYSLDFMIGNVALELKSGTGYRGDPDRKNGRIKYLKERGISTIYLIFEDVQSIINNVDFILDIVLNENKNPCNTGEYKVIVLQYEKYERLRNSKGQFYAVEKEPVLIKKLLTLKY